MNSTRHSHDTLSVRAVRVPQIPFTSVRVFSVAIGLTWLRVPDPRIYLPFMVPAMPAWALVRIESQRACPVKPSLPDLHRQTQLRCLYIFCVESP